MCNVGIVCEQNSVIGHHWVAGGQNASCHMAYAVQNAVIHQEVIHQQLHTQKDIQIAAGRANATKKSLISAWQTAKAYPKLFYSPL